MFAKYLMGLGLPPNNITSFEKLKSGFDFLTEKQMENKQYRLLNYGYRRGDEENISIISSWYSSQIKCNLQPRNTFLTYGCTHAIIISIMTILKSGDNILVECPTFFSMIKVFEDFGLNQFPAERLSNEDGFDLVALEESVIKNKIKAFYLVTNFNNPLGVNLSTKTRCALYQLAHKHKFYIISDDIYELLYFNEKDREVPLFFCDDGVSKGRRDHLLNFENDRSEFIISVNSFNKIVCPSVRTGFLYAHSSLIEKMTGLGIIISAMGQSGIGTYLVTSFIELGYVDEIAKGQRSHLYENMKIVMEVFKTCSLIEFDIPKGGYFVLLRLDKKVNLIKLNSLQSKNDLNFVNGINFVIEKYRDVFYEYNNTIRVSVSYLDKEKIKEAAEILVKMIYESVDS